MKTPAKPCNGRFSEETVQTLLKNVDRAQWLPHKCPQCEQLVGAKLEKGLWVPEPHWPSVIARRSTGSGGQQRREKSASQAALAGEPASILSRSKQTSADSRTTFVLPDAANELLEMASIPPAAEAPVSLAPSAMRVFVVDDEFNIASTLGLILRHHGFLATAFTGPMEALEAVAAQPPDLLISDVAMPQLSGVELAMRVRELAPECKILLFSGEAASTGLVEAARARGHNFELLSRPLHPAELLKRIHKLTGGTDVPVLGSI